MSTPVVALAVITHDRKEMLLRLLDSFLRQGHPPDRTEIIVVDDGSSDGTAEAVEAWFKTIEPRGFRRLLVRRHEHPIHSSGARMIGLQAVSPDVDWVLSCDDDLVLGDRMLERLLEAGRDPRAGMLGPRIVFLRHPELVFSSAHYVGRWTARYSAQDPLRTTECDWLNSSVCLIRGEALRRRPPDYGDYYTGHEDVDYSLQLGLDGWKVLYVPSASALHDVEPTLFRPARLYYLYRNKFIVIRRNFPWPQRWAATAFHATVGFARALLRLLRKPKGRRRYPTEVAGVVLAAFRDGLLDRRGFKPEYTPGPAPKEAE